MDPLETCMTLQNPESDNQIYSVAPAEGEKPLSFTTDKDYEAMCNPCNFPYGNGTFNASRERKLTYRKYFNQRLLDVDGRFAKDLDYFHVKDKTAMNEFINKDKAYRFMKNVRAYYQCTFYDLLAMIRQLGTPTWFLTLSAADMKWPDMIQTIAKPYGVKYTDDVAKPLGEIIDYAIRVEFQARGSPHAHNVIWVKDVPKFGHDSDENVCNFIDKYVSCAIPENDCKLKELVLLLQQHKHSSYCKRGRSCRFNFP